MKITQGNTSPHPWQSEPSAESGSACLVDCPFPGTGMGFTCGWTQWGQTCGSATHTVTTRFSGCDLCTHQHLPASTVCLYKQHSGCRQGLGAQAATKLVMVRHGMEAHQYPRLHEGNCQQGKGGDPSTLLCTILVNHSWCTEPAQQHPVTGQEAMGRYWIW